MRSQMVGALVPPNSRPESHLRARDLRKGFGAGAVLDLFTVLGLAGSDETPSMLSLAIAVPFAVFGLALLVELGFRRGTVGPNQYGPDPLATR